MICLYNFDFLPSRDNNQTRKVPPTFKGKLKFSSIIKCGIVNSTAAPSHLKRYALITQVSKYLFCFNLLNNYFDLINIQIVSNNEDNSDNNFPTQQRHTIFNNHLHLNMTWVKTPSMAKSSNTLNCTLMMMMMIRGDCVVLRARRRHASSTMGFFVNTNRLFFVSLRLFFRCESKVTGA